MKKEIMNFLFPITFQSSLLLIFYLINIYDIHRSLILFPISSGILTKNFQILLTKKKTEERNKLIISDIIYGILLWISLSTILDSFKVLTPPTAILYILLQYLAINSVNCRIDSIFLLLIISIMLPIIKYLSIIDLNGIIIEPGLVIQNDLLDISANHLLSSVLYLAISLFTIKIFNINFKFVGVTFFFITILDLTEFLFGISKSNPQNSIMNNLNINYKLFEAGINLIKIIRNVENKLRILYITLLLLIICNCYIFLQNIKKQIYFHGIFGILLIILSYMIFFNKVFVISSNEIPFFNIFYIVLGFCILIFGYEILVKIFGEDSLKISNWISGTEVEGTNL